MAGSIRSKRAFELLTHLISAHGARRYLRSDNGLEFISRAILEWLPAAGIETALIDLGKHWRNGADEFFNRKLRDKYLSLEWFRSRTEARVVIENWSRHHNAVRPHNSWQYLTPHEFRRQHQPVPNRAVSQE